MNEPLYDPCMMCQNAECIVDKLCLSCRCGIPSKHMERLGRVTTSLYSMACPVQRQLTYETQIVAESRRWQRSAALN